MGQEYFLIPQTSFVFYPALHAVDWSGLVVYLTTHVHLVSTLRMTGSVIFSPHVCLHDVHCDDLKTRSCHVPADWIWPLLVFFRHSTCHVSHNLEILLWTLCDTILCWKFLLLLFCHPCSSSGVLHVYYSEPVCDQLFVQIRANCNLPPQYYPCHLSGWNSANLIAITSFLEMP